MTPGDERAEGWMGAWRGRDAVVLGLGLLVAIAVRAALLPADGLRGDIDQFVVWTHGLTTAPFGNAYDQELTFGPVMVCIWGALATFEPGFVHVFDANSPLRSVIGPKVAAATGTDSDFIGLGERGSRHPHRGSARPIRCRGGGRPDRQRCHP